MKLKILLLANLLAVFVTYAQNSSEIKNNGDKNEFDVSQTGIDSLNSSKIDNKGKQNKFKQRQNQQQRKPAFNDTLKNSESKTEKPITTIAENSKSIFEAIAALILLIGGVVSLYRQFKKKKED